MFAIPQGELKNYRLLADLYLDGDITEGTWKVSYKMQSTEKLVYRVKNADAIEITPFGVYVLGYSGEGTPQQSVSSTWEVWKIWITDSTTPTAGKGGTVGEQYYRFIEGYDRNGQSKIYDFGGAYNGMFYLSESVNSDGAPIPSNRVPDGYYSHNGNSAYYKTAWVQDPTATVGPNEPIPEVARDIYRYPVYHIENGRITETLYVYFYYDSSQIIRPCSGDGYDFPDLDYQFLWRYLHIV